MHYVVCNNNFEMIPAWLHNQKRDKLAPSLVTKTIKILWTDSKGILSAYLFFASQKSGSVLFSKRNI